MPWQREDESHDLPSDVEFGVWLMNLEPDVVKRDGMPMMSDPERFTYWWYVKYGSHDE